MLDLIHQGRGYTMFILSASQNSATVQTPPQTPPSTPVTRVLCPKAGKTVCPFFHRKLTSPARQSYHRNLAESGIRLALPCPEEGALLESYPCALFPSSFPLARSTTATTVRAGGGSGIRQPANHPRRAGYRSLGHSRVCGAEGAEACRAHTHGGGARRRVRCGADKVRREGACRGSERRGAARAARWTCERHRAGRAERAFASANRRGAGQRRLPYAWGQQRVSPRLSTAAGGGGGMLLARCGGTSGTANARTHLRGDRMQLR
ncbi:hypothetical protein C8R47DRAFT_743474 [Mycena vitilis]|nr:hypothetical protein C8R47DRAFT_743474 [Mycena vitilis]